jgi:putative ABC transport system ATP-binding protein
VGWLGFLRLPERPIASDDIVVDDGTTPRQLIVRSMLAVNRLTVPATALMVVQQASQAAVPIVIGLAIDRAVAPYDGGSLIGWLAVLVGVYVVLAVSYRLAFRLEILAMQIVCYQLRLKVARAVLDPRRETRESPGVGLSIFTTDVNRLGQAPGLLVYPVGDLVAITIVAIALFVISWPLGLLVLVGTPTMMWLLDRVAGPVRQHTFAQLEHVADATASAADLVAGLRVIKGLGAEAAAADRYRTVSQEAFRATLRVKSAQARYEVVTDLIAGLFIAAVATLIGWLALRGDIEVGELVTAVGLTQFVAAPVQSLTKDFGARLAEVRASAQRVLGVLQARRVDDRRAVTFADGEVPPLELRDVRLGVVAGLALTVAPGELVGVVTDSGTAQLLEDTLGLFQPPEDGAIFVGDVDARAVDADDLRRVLLTAPHSADLFDASVLQNIDPAADAGVPSESARAAIHASALGDVVETLANGLSTRVGEGGAMLSGGQRQRVALARALAARPPILVLHEPTTAVDSVTEALIAARLRDLRRGASTLVVTTSPTLLAVADRVVWIRADEVTVGEHARLMNDPDYAGQFA